MEKGHPVREVAAVERRWGRTVAAVQLGSGTRSCRVRLVSAAVSTRATSFSTHSAAVAGRHAGLQPRQHVSFENPTPIQVLDHLPSAAIIRSARASASLAAASVWWRECATQSQSHERVSLRICTCSDGLGRAGWNDRGTVEVLKLTVNGLLAH